MVAKNTKIFPPFWIEAKTMIRRGANNLCFLNTEIETTDFTKMGEK